ncbi:hypothetical protein MRB53_007661 [Persea americana]|uniref:Uncharacterized protein n=1 Tax=Persea americana TaxID=3435 RepID=A0ACC2MKM0_PERAE|nr:hypothetical protein MRB53_007661 [Persea americana]
MIIIFLCLHFYRFYNSLPPVSKAYGSLCLLTTTAYQLGLLNPVNIALIYDAVISRFQFEVDQFSAVD